MRRWIELAVLWVMAAVLTSYTVVILEMAFR